MPILQPNPKPSPPSSTVLSCRSIGEIGITGSSAAVANAIFNATGKRIRNYTIHPRQNHAGLIAFD